MVQLHFTQGCGWTWLVRTVGKPLFTFDFNIVFPRNFLSPKGVQNTNITNFYQCLKYYLQKNPFKTLDFVSLIPMKLETSCIHVFFSHPFDVPWGLINPSMQWSISDHTHMHALHVRKQCGPVTIPDSKVHGAKLGPTWVLSSPGGPHVGPMYLAIWGLCLSGGIHTMLTYIHTCWFLTADLWCQATRYGDGDMSSCILYGVWH